MSNYSFNAVIFDLDGVVTKTARVHGKAWKALFDEYLRLREKRNGEPFREFTHDGDYLPFIDGKPRYKGIESFLKSRDITLPMGSPTDSADMETLCGLGNKKNLLFRENLKQYGAEVFVSTIKFIEELKKAGVRVGVASSSKNCKLVLETAAIDSHFETRVCGLVSAELGLKGKPEGDIFVAAARNLGVTPDEAVVIEDANSGVQAGRNGGFGLVVGVARKNNISKLLKNGADVVVHDLSELTIEWTEQWFQQKPKLLFDAWQDDGTAQIYSRKVKKMTNGVVINPYYARLPQETFVCDKKLVFFLDYDGTLTPIVDRPDLAVMDERMRDTVRQLSQKHLVAIVSGRMREDVEKLVGIEGLFYAGSHGFDILGPGFSMINPAVKKIVPLVSQVIVRLKGELVSIPGVLIEEKKFSVAVHYRLVDEKKYLPKIKNVVDEIICANPTLRLMSGKKVFEILPNMDWDKGRAIRWIMKALKINWSKSAVIYIGDDVTDEYAFRAIRTRGTGILVSNIENKSAAHFQLSSPDEVKKLFEKVITST